MLVLDSRDLRYFGRSYYLLSHPGGVVQDLQLVHPHMVDAHMHLWDLDEVRYPWLTPPLPVGITGDVRSIAKTYRLDDYLRDAGGEGGKIRVAKVVHVEAGANPADSLKETRWLQRVADARGYPQALVAHAELNNPKVEALLAEHASHHNVRGIRQILNWHADPKKTYTPRDLLADTGWEKGFALLRKYNLSFDLQVYPGQMQAAAQLASRHPDTPIILNHTGMPVDRDGAGLQAWRAGMQALAQQRNVAVKISGLAMLDWQWTLDSLRPFVLQTIELFGTERCLFASNFPVDRLFGSFARHYGAYQSLTASLSATERAQVFATNAERIYRI
jgi:predicted TIM-barrel fold metal-dependent hydrolase